MTGLRTYGDPCGIAKALDAIGERWALLIVRELAYGPRRFTDLRDALGASPNVLSQRLDELEQVGVIERRASGGAQYDLTDRGRALHPVLLALAVWGHDSPLQPMGELSVSALMLALEAQFNPDLAGDLAARVELRLGDEVFSAEVGRGSIAVTRARRHRPDATIIADTATLRAAIIGDGRPVTAAPEIRGDATMGQRFLGLFTRC